MAVHGVRNTAGSDEVRPAVAKTRAPARGLSQTERRLLVAILREEEAHPGALPELRRVAAEILDGDRERAERVLRKLTVKALLIHCTEGYAFGELSRTGRLEARRLASEGGPRSNDQGT